MSTAHLNHVLVTGGAGFIGSNFVRHLLAQEPDVRLCNLDLLTYAGSLENLRELPGAERHTFVQGDINDRALVDRLLREHRIDTIVNFAAESHVDRSIRAPDHFVQTNIHGTFTLLEAARAHWAADDGFEPGACFLHISTDEVFGSLEPDAPAFNEDTPYAPRSPYAASKAAADHMVRAYQHTYGFPAMITICSNNYGPYQFPEKLIPLMLLNAQQGKLLPIYGDGLQIRDWLYVEEHCRGLLVVLRQGRLGETYNIGGNNQTANLDLVQQLCTLLDGKLADSLYASHADLIQFVADRPGHDRRYAMDTRKIEEELGWQPQEDLASGLAKTVSWYLENPDWLQAISQQPDYEAWVAENYERR